MRGCKGEKVSFSPASPLTLVAAATHLPSLWPIGCPKLNSAQPHPAACCSLAPCGACPPLAGSAFPALFGLNYFFESWSHYFWIVIWSGRFSFPGFLLFSSLCAPLDALPKVFFHSFFGGGFITSMHLIWVARSSKSLVIFPPGPLPGWSLGECFSWKP